MIFSTTNIIAQDLYVDEVLPQIHADIIPNIDSPIDFTFKKRVEIESGVVFLGDLLGSCKGLDNVCNIISHIEIGSSPEIGKSESLSHVELIKLLKSEYPSVKPASQSQGSTTVYSKFQYIDKSSLENIVEEFFEGLSGSQVKYKVYSFRVERPVRTRTKDLTYSVSRDFKIEDLDTSFQRNKSAIIPIVGKSSDGLSEDVLVKVKVFYGLSKLIPVALKEVRRGQRIYRDNFEFKWVKLTARFITDMSNLDGKQAKRRLLVGRPVRYKDIQRQMLVKRGKIKEVGIASSGIVIVTPARMLDNGSEGETVRVKVLKTKKILHGIVKKDGSIEVVL